MPKLWQKVKFWATQEYFSLSLGLVHRPSTVKQLRYGYKITLNLPIPWSDGHFIMILGGGGGGWENFVKEEGGRGGGQYFD